MPILIIIAIFPFCDFKISLFSGYSDSMMLKLDGRVALVTGGSRGIGASVSKLLARSGASVCFTYLNDDRSARRCEDEILRMGQSCMKQKIEVSNASKVRKAVDAVLERFKRIDILVNNAGVWKRGEIGKMSEEQWDETLDVNLKGTFLFCNAVAPAMKKQAWGRIVNIASTAGQRGEAFYSHYAASKGAVIAFTKSIAVELAPYNINANCVAPGWVDTDMTANILQKRSERKVIERIIPRGKVATPEDIAGAVLFLASDLADHIVGATINVNGGGVLM